MIPFSSSQNASSRPFPLSSCFTNKVEEYVTQKLIVKSSVPAQVTGFSEPASIKTNLFAAPSKHQNIPASAPSHENVEPSPSKTDRDKGYDKDLYEGAADQSSSEVMRSLPDNEAQEELMSFAKLLGLRDDDNGVLVSKGGDEEVEEEVSPTWTREKVEPVDQEKGIKAAK
jgi:hypothetical protein